MAASSEFQMRAFQQIVSNDSGQLKEFLCDTFCLEKADIGNVKLDVFGENIVNKEKTVLFLKYSDCGDTYMFKYDSRQKTPFEIWEHDGNCCGLSCDYYGCYN